ncbi:chlorhexidine efflux transporter, partial [Pseudomonas aeruginosa]|uniref:chlorhexidine efflux transporter n=1 Tax=Pseudomonas aeruginosa TaxID=287 RepID=UPI003EE0A8F5
RLILSLPPDKAAPGLVEAFLLDMGLILFFLPYTMAFNWSYDVLRARLVESRQAKAAGCDAG